MSTSETSPTSASPTEARHTTTTTTTTVKTTFTSTSATAAAASVGSSKGFQVTHTSYHQGTPPFRTASPPMAPAAFAGPREGAAAGSPLLSPQLPPSAVADGNVPPRSPHKRCPSSSSATAPGNTPPLGPRVAAVPLITPRYQKKSRTTRQMNVTDGFPEQQTPSGALRQEATERLTVQSGPMQYEQEMHFHTYDVYRHGKRQIHTRSVGYSSDGDLVMLREDYSEPSDVDNGFVRKRTEISDPTVLDPRARRPLTEKELQSKEKLHLNRPRYKKYPGIRAPKNRKVRNRLLNDYFAHELAREILVKAQKWRELKGDEPTTTAGPSFADLPKAVMHAMDLVGEEQLLEFERLHIHPDVLAPQLRNAKPSPHPDSPEGRFQGLNTRLRGELQHALNSEFLTQQIEDLEVHFMDFIKKGAKSTESLVFYFRDGYGRLICHGVAAYYLLVSESHTMMDGSGTKLTYVSLPKTRQHGVRAVNPPHVPLLLVLRRNRRNLPGKHSLSAQNTPKVAPARDPVAPPAPLLELEPAVRGQAPGMEADEVMSPLDLNAPAMPPTAGCAKADPCPPAAAFSTGGGEGTSPSSERNPAVLRTVRGKLPTAGPLPLYTPLLRLVLTAEEQADAAAELDAASVSVTPVLGPADPPAAASAAAAAMTATQRKKLRRAERVRSAEASQDDSVALR